MSGLRERWPPQGLPAAEEYYARMLWGILTWELTVPAMTTGQIYLTPFQAEQTITIDRLGVSVRTANGNIRLGIYRAVGDVPDAGALLAETASVVAVARGKQEVAIVPATLELTPGLYWLASQYDDNTIRLMATGQDTGDLGTLIVRQAAQVYGAFPNPCPVTGAGTAVPIMFVRVVI